MLITPTVLYEASYKEYIKELGNEERYPYPLDLDHSNFASFVNLLNGYSMGVNGMKLLNLTLEKAFEIGVDEVHIHCYKSNKVSSSLIASSGAKLDSIVETQGKNEQVLRFVHSRC